MAPLTLYLAKLIGAIMLAGSIWMAAKKPLALALVKRLIGDEVAVAYLGFLRICVGLALVLGHDVWSGGALPVIITLIGWFELLRGLLILFLPHERLVALFESMRFEKHYAAYVGGVFLFSGYLLIAGFTG